jgi:hypothetical protein
VDKETLSKSLEKTQRGYQHVKSRYSEVLSRIEDLEKELNDVKAN